MAIPNDLTTLSDSDLEALMNDRRFSDTERVNMICEYLRRLKEE